MNISTEKNAIHDNCGAYNNGVFTTTINMSSASEAIAERLWNESSGPKSRSSSVRRRERSSSQSQRIPDSEAAIKLVSKNGLSNGYSFKTKTHHTETARLKRMPAAKM